MIFNMFLSHFKANFNQIIADLNHQSLWIPCRALYKQPVLFYKPVFLMQERSDVAQKIINAIKKKRGKMILGIERLCDAYITLAYMDASRHKNEKSE